MADFTDTRNILNRKPNINFVEPDQVDDDRIPETIEVEKTINQRKQEIETIIQQYTRLEKLSEVAEKRIDSRAKEFKVCLDPNQDAAVLQCLQRQFGTDTACITYKQYKECIKKLSAAGRKSANFVTPSKMKDAISDPFRKDFGGSGSLPGRLRPELTVQNPIEPVDVPQFQKEALDELFKLLLPKLVGLNNYMIAEAIKEAISKL